MERSDAPRHAGISGWQRALGTVQPPLSRQPRRAPHVGGPLDAGAGSLALRSFNLPSAIHDEHQYQPLV